MNSLLWWQAWREMSCRESIVTGEHGSWRKPLTMPIYFPQKFLFFSNCCIFLTESYEILLKY